MRLALRHAGEILLALVLCLSLFLMVSMMAPIATNVMAGRVSLFDRRVVFDRQGTPRIQVVEQDYSHKRRRRHVVWYDLNYKEIGKYDYHRAPRLRLGGIIDLDTVLRSNWRGGHRADLTGWRYLPPPGEEVPIWHRLPYRGLLAGYIYPQGQFIGYIGRSGYIGPDATGEGFVNPRFIASVPKIGEVWVDHDRIYAININSKTVLQLWKSPSGQPIRALGFVSKKGIAICGNTIRVFDVNPKSFLSFKRRVILEGPLPDDLRQNIAWQVAWHDKHKKLVISNLSHREATVYHLSPKCEVLDSWEMNVRVTPSLTRTRIIALSVASSIMSPWMGVAVQKVLEHKFPDTYRLVKRWLEWPYQRPFLAVSLTLTLLSVVLACWHLWRRCTWFQMILGIAVALVFSWPGYLVCLSLFDLEARVRCPICGRRRAVSSMKCPRCKAGWPSQPQSGCEILLPAR